MAFHSSTWADIDGGIVELDTEAGPSKRLCTGLSGGMEPRPTPPTLQTQWAANQAQSLPQQSLYNVSGNHSSAVNVQGRSASPFDFYNLSRQHVGTLQGQSWFQDHQDLPWPPSDYDSPPSRLQVVDTTTPSPYHWAPDVPAVENATSSAFFSWNQPSSASGFQPIPTSSTTPHAENTHEQYHQSDCGTTPQYACQDIASGGTFEPEESMDTRNEDTTYEVCLGLVRHSFVGSSLWTTVPSYSPRELHKEAVLDPRLN